MSMSLAINMLLLLNTYYMNLVPPNTSFKLLTPMLSFLDWWSDFSCAFAERLENVVSIIYSPFLSAPRKEILLSLLNSSVLLSRC